VKTLQDQLLALHARNIKPVKEAILPPSPSIRPAKPKVEGIVRQDETGFVEISFSAEGNDIEVKPEDEVLLVSEFTNWKQDKLKPEHRNGKTVFTGKYKLDSGFKYKFRFIVCGNTITDVNQPRITNSAGYSYNYAIVARPDEGTPVSLERDTSYINPNVKTPFDLFLDKRRGEEAKC
jgi:hypothetical protein